MCIFIYLELTTEPTSTLLFYVVILHLFNFLVGYKVYSDGCCMIIVVIQTFPESMSELLLPTIMDSSTLFSPLFRLRFLFFGVASLYSRLC